MKLQIWYGLPLSLLGVILGAWINQQLLVQASVVVLIVTIIILKLREMSK